MSSSQPSIVHLIERVHRLKDVSDPEKAAPDGQTIEGRMQKLCANVADDIKRCANTCDTYLKLVFVVYHPTSPFLTANQEEAPCKNLRWTHMGRPTFGVRWGVHGQAERVRVCDDDPHCRWRR